jgi:hypothetical protein
MSTQKKSWVPNFFFWLGALVCIAIVITLWPNRSYYFLPLAERPLHPNHQLLRSSGKWGLSYGIAGTVLMFLNLTYLLRKQLINIQWLGALRSWMAFHVFTGLLGGALVLFHSTLSPHSALGILGFISLWIVVITGLIGRYIYAHIPRLLEGRELELEEIRSHLEEYRIQLDRLGVGSGFFAPLPTSADHNEKSLLTSLLGLVTGDAQMRRDLKNLKHRISQTPRLQSQMNEIISLARRYHTERDWLIRYYELRSLMGRWRFFHRWFAIVVLVMAFFHIAVSIQMGNLWFLNGRG